MPSIQLIEYVAKRDCHQCHERITHVGGIVDGCRWKLTQQEAVAGINIGKWKFFATVNGQRVGVVVANDDFRNPYLCTEADRDNCSLLLDLPELA